LKYDFTSRIIGDIYIKKEEQNNTPLSHNIKYLPVDLGLQDIQKKDIIDSLENIKAKYIGLATHYCLEMLKEFDLKSLDTTINIVKTKYSNYLEDNDIEYIYNIIKSLLLDNTFLELISNSTYSKEQELIYNNDIKIIDLLIEKESRYIVIDYKTSKEVQQSHISQVNYYKKAISSIFNSIVDGYLVYLDQNKARIIKV
jgi:exodeoxyribonuclease V beta subunit